MAERQLHHAAGFGHGTDQLPAGGSRRCDQRRDVGSARAFPRALAGLAAINAAGVYAQLVAAHVGERGAAQAAIETQDATVTARIEVAAGKVADLDRQIGQIDAAVAAATQRAKANTAVSVMEGQRKARSALAGDREKAADALPL